MNRRYILGASLLSVGFSAFAQEASVAPPLFTVGSVEVRPSFAYGITADDNIFLAHSTSGRKDDDVQHTFSPGVTLGAGDYRAQNGSFVSANYNANFLVFQDNSGANAVTHNAAVTLGGGERLSWRLSQLLVSDADADVQNLAAGGRVARDIWTTTLSTVYDLSDKTDLESRFSSIISDYDSFGTFDTWRGQGAVMLDYEATAKVHYALGATFGYDQVDGFNNSVYEQLNSRLVWTVSPKLALRTGVGVEFRQFQGSNLDRTSPIFDIGADWIMSELTVVSVGAARGVRASNSLGNQYTTRTSFDLRGTHRFGDRYAATLSTGYSQSEAKLGGASAVFAQTDDYWFINPSLGIALMDRATANVGYQFRRNDSDALANASDFINHQATLSLSYAF